ncbi:glycosyltransferase family 1 protein [Burkholderia cepacia]|uniref:Glycosyltransferase family 1 protein n=1 Tax=Burkholderia cepacia TaxID=292 RepID=A0AAX2RK27_BURCE|nr:glycosyltransferase family 1 protein [Burkholderia cepacia]TES71306.1 glycosyltransferase family 1 protein [Burkholderia cepacia]TET03587.1 glycosyltransferase family 1 protein [Burkholderia cepacia]TEU40489.1 glycosyltransferase family 1 protein [Burkholderia cepacia]TEU44603.1 glycosyltransferase family 1 protein [Burkholderia cepacia]TEU54303.1 glycosyltransferase family 1 protein [Burkholderia cepacia]
MTKILLDVTRLATRFYDGLIPTGVDRVGLAYIRRYGDRARAVLSERGFSIVLTEKDSQKIFALLLSSSRDRWALRKIIASALLNQLYPPRFDRAILLHTSHNGMEFPRYYRAMAQRNARSVFMVHDLIPLTHPEYCRPGVDASHRARIHTALRHASGLISNSQATYDELANEARQASLPLPPVVVAPLAPAVEPHPPSPPPIAAPYFVMLSTIEPRKNHWFILHVWRHLVEQMGDAAPKLVVIGRRGWECENVIDMLERCATIRSAVIEESDCSDDRLHAWLQHARALVFPSFAEGYGMPLVEALMLGVPVLASDLPVFHEIASDIPDYLDPLDGPGWLARIRAYALPDSTERANQIARIERFRAPTWAEHFEQIDGFLESLR